MPVSTLAHRQSPLSLRTEPSSWDSRTSLSTVTGGRSPNPVYPPSRTVQPASLSAAGAEGTSAGS
eukprot:9132-Pyramimonas_sp.AAC.2